MKYEWKQIESIEGVAQQFLCEGEMFGLEIQVQDDGTIVGEVWREIHATFWEPSDSLTLLEEVYPSFEAAKAALEKYDSDAAEAEAELDRLLDEAREQAR